MADGYYESLLRDDEEEQLTPLTGRLTGPETKLERIQKAKEAAHKKKLKLQKKRNFLTPKRGDTVRCTSGIHRDQYALVTGKDHGEFLLKLRNGKKIKKSELDIDVIPREIAADVDSIAYEMRVIKTETIDRDPEDATFLKGITGRALQDQDYRTGFAKIRWDHPDMNDSWETTETVKKISTETYVKNEDRG